MKRSLALVVALMIVALVGGVALAGADCSYHKTQAAVDNATTNKEVATAPASDKTNVDQVQTAQVAKPAPQPAAEVKK
jgi:hypothetical protein